jgi:hypothetical protein
MCLTFAGMSVRAKSRKYTVSVNASNQVFSRFFGSLGEALVLQVELFITMIFSLCTVESI